MSRPTREREPRERSATIRQQIIELMKEGPVTPLDISGRLRISEREAAAHLEHAVASASRGHAVRVTPARCRACGFVFKDRAKVKRPSRCPRCKETRLEPATYSIEE
jgi:predicted Zn-ribbon and HTH transcriptional regulator